MSFDEGRAAINEEPGAEMGRAPVRRVSRPEGSVRIETAACERLQASEVFVDEVDLAVPARDQAVPDALGQVVERVVPQLVDAGLDLLPPTGPVGDRRGIEVVPAALGIAGKERRDERDTRPRIV